ncbi:hypothetical protein MAV101_01330 [Mycobacterium avium subsp. hominissuis 101]|nr:hypothetical protein MAV101_01330 [Mycobacterium avium subsp. hominissuis 101]
MVDEAPTGPTAAEAKAAQTAAITAAVDELAALWKEIEAGATCPSPQRIEDTAAEESPNRVARIWQQRLVDEAKRRELFGCNAAVQVRATGTGVTIRAEIRPDMDAAESIARFQQAALAMGSGHYAGWLEAGTRGPHGGQVIMLNRAVVGTDPATAFRAVNHRVYQVYADESERRESLWFNAGLAVRKIDKRYSQKPRAVYRYEFPTIIECLAESDSRRGPAFVIELHREQGVEDFEAALPKLRALLRCDLNLVPREEGLVELQLLQRKQTSWPKETPLSPTQLWRPRNRAESLVAARDGVLIPFGVDRSGSPLMLDMRKRPHFLITGTSGAGKSTALRLILRALQMQLGRGGTIVLGDGKAADMIPVYAANVGQNLSLENASIHRAIAYAYDELGRRKKMYKRLIARELPEIFPLLILCIDELGAWAGQGLAKGSPKRDAVGVEAAMAKLRYVLRQGRSYGVHVIISTQDVTIESGINTALLSVVSTRVVVGRPEEGSGSAMDKLFTNAERPRVAAAAKEIPPGSRGIGVMVDEAGVPTLFKAFYNDGEAARVFDAATAAAGRARRFAWKFPDDDGAWLARTCAEFEGLEPVDSIPTIPLEDERGRYIEQNARYDEGNVAEHAPGTPADNTAHETY